MAPVSRKELLNTQATVECGFTLKRMRDMIRTYNQLERKSLSLGSGKILLEKNLKNQERFGDEISQFCAS